MCGKISGRTPRAISASMLINWRYKCSFGFQITSLSINSFGFRLLTLQCNLHSPHCKAWHSSEVQSTVCRAVKGGTYLPSHHLDFEALDCKLNCYHHHHRVASLRSHDFVISLQNGGCSPESPTHTRILLQGRDKAKQYINIRTFACPRIFGPCALWS